MIIIDGEKGEGGGQVLRTALSLSACTGQPFRIKNIRGKRKKPGLLRQHLTCVKATAEICGGKATGAVLGSTDLTFTPGDIRAGEYLFDIGSAGSTGLVFQTVLPVLLQADEPSRVTFCGGTHNKSAPPYEFITESFLPALARMGVRVETTLHRRGYFPAGGGRWEATIYPLEEPKALDLTELGEVLSVTAEAATANLPGNIAERELTEIKARLGLPDECLLQRTYEAEGPGNAVLIRIKREGHTEIVAGFGEHGISAESVGKRAANEAKACLGVEDCVGSFLADQLLLPVSVSGAQCKFRTLPPSAHFRTNVETIAAFLDVKIDATDCSDKFYTVNMIGV